MSLHPMVEEAIQEIDAAFFSGDQFHAEEDLARIEKFLLRWGREATRIKADLNSQEQDEE